MCFDCPATFDADEVNAQVLLSPSPRCDTSIDLDVTLNLQNKKAIFLQPQNKIVHMCLCLSLVWSSRTQLWLVLSFRSGTRRRQMRHVKQSVREAQVKLYTKAIEAWSRRKRREIWGASRGYKAITYVCHVGIAHSRRSVQPLLNLWPFGRGHF
jgi:hypothetical protein